MELVTFPYEFNATEHSLGARQGDLAMDAAGILPTIQTAHETLRDVRDALETTATVNVVPVTRQGNSGWGLYITLNGWSLCSAGVLGARGVGDVRRRRPAAAYGGGAPTS